MQKFANANNYRFLMTLYTPVETGGALKPG
jgi:hypothetical protein